MTIPSSEITDGGADRKQQVVALLKSIETGAREPLGVVDAHAYKQHNLGAEEGVEGFVSYCRGCPGAQRKLTR